MFLPYPLILASQSPRRQDLLKQAGFTFTTINRDVSENFPDELSAIEAALYIADQKIQAYQDLVNQNIVICADTIVVQDQIILGKPENKKEALDMLGKLSGKAHEVITAVVISGPSGTKSFTETTKVIFEILENSEIIEYVDKFQPYDKAGAYGIQEWIGLIGIKEIQGSYFNVVGLPIHRVYQELKSFCT